MKQLELKDICGYLPYGLKVMHNEWEEILTMDCAGSSSNSLSIEDVSEYAKPLLRPLSDLTKEITHKGETFVPMLELAKLAMNDTDLRLVKSRIVDNVKNWHCGIVFDLLDFTPEDDEFVSDTFVFTFSIEQGFAIQLKGKNGTKHLDNCVFIHKQPLMWQKLYECMFDINDLIGDMLAISTTSQDQNIY